MTAPTGPTIEAPDDDPYLWLEEIEGEAALAWVAARNQETRAAFADAGFEAERDALATLLGRADRLPHVRRRGDWLYNFWTDRANPRGLWRRTTLAAYRDETPAWDLLFDLDALSGAEGEDWVWGGATVCPMRPARAILRLSRGGGDAVVLREFDIETGRFVDDGFVLDEAKGGVSWLDPDTVLLSSAHGEGMATASGYARCVRRWHRGTAPEIVFTAGADSMAVWATVETLPAAAPRVWFHEAEDFQNVAVWQGDGAGPRERLDLPSDSWPQIQGDWLAFRPRRPWSAAGRTFAADTLLGISVDALRAGEGTFEVLFEAAPRRVPVEDGFWAGGRFVQPVLDDLVPVFELFTPGDAGWSRERIAGVPSVATARVGRLDADPGDSNGDLLLDLEGPLTPPSLLLIEPGAAPALLKREGAAFEAEGLVARRHEALADDGTRIPYFQVGPADEDSGRAPVHLHGYGGFEVAELPVYRKGIGKLWLEAGGTAVTACLRGGGEFGSAWHQAGCGAGKRLAQDDFAAVARDLVARGVTVPGRIAAEGGSNGGLLIANMLVRHPERFGALFCTIPLVDMRRYTKLLAGASWIAEYGDPDDPADWAHLKTYSAYHLAATGERYPPILLATLRRDDRVHPGHARKFAAKLQALGHEAWFHEPATGGHGHGRDLEERAAFTALGYRFLKRSIGWDSTRTR